MFGDGGGKGDLDKCFTKLIDYLLFSALGDDNERDITIEDLKDLKYLENCIKASILHKF